MRPLYERFMRLAMYRSTKGSSLHRGSESLAHEIASGDTAWVELANGLEFGTSTVPRRRNCAHSAAIARKGLSSARCPIRPPSGAFSDRPDGADHIRLRTPPEP